MSIPEFEIKKGMVFYLEEPAREQPVSCASSKAPKKNRPYMVLSNNKCNKSSDLINVAPIITKDHYKAKPYHAVFCQTDGRECVVDVGAVMLIDKSLCNATTYSESITQCVIYDTSLFKKINRALCHQFDISAAEVLNSSGTSINTDNIPHINLTINFEGEKPKVITTYDPVEEVTSHTVLEKETKEDSKIIVDNVPAENNQKEKIGRPKTVLSKYRKDFIKNNCIVFGGSMTPTDIAEKLNISLRSVYYHINNIEVQNIDSDFKYKNLDTIQKKRILRDSQNMRRDDLVNKYRMKDRKQLANTLYRIRQEFGIKVK